MQTDQAKFVITQKFSNICGKIEEIWVFEQFLSGFHFLCNFFSAARSAQSPLRLLNRASGNLFAGFLVLKFE